MKQLAPGTTRVLNTAASVLAGVIAVALPAVFFALEYKSHVASMNVEARFSALEVSDLINKNPDFWQFENPRLERLLQDKDDEGLPEARRLLDLKGAVISENAQPLDAPVMRRSSPLLDSGRAVGTFEVARSLRPLLMETAALGFIGLFLGSCVLMLLRVYPLRSLNRALESLAGEKRRAELILNSIEDGVITTDAKGVVLSVNPVVRKIFGYAAHEMVGQDVKIILPPADHPRHDALAARYFQTGDTRRFGIPREIRGRRSDGSVFAMELHMSEFHSEGQQNFLASLRDITERKKAKDELIQLNASLEQRVAQRTEQMQAAIEELEAFSFSVSHDLRAPLTTIGGFSNLLGKELRATEASPRATHCLNRINSGVTHMSGLIEALLRLAQLSRTPLKLGSVDLSALAHQVMDGYQEREPARQAQWVVQPGMRAQGDVELLRQVLENLLGNAWKFSGKQDQTHIAFRCDVSPAGETVYAVQDQGAGFDMTHADKLFSAFQRLHSEADFSGTGIGLATVQRIIARHGGRVWGQSERGQGATFSFTLDTSAVLEAQA